MRSPYALLLTPRKLGGCWPQFLKPENMRTEAEAVAAFP